MKKKTKKSKVGVVGKISLVPASIPPPSVIQQILAEDFSKRGVDLYGAKLAVIYKGQKGIKVLAKKDSYSQHKKEIVKKADEFLRKQSPYFAKQPLYFRLVNKLSRGPVFKVKGRLRDGSKIKKELFIKTTTAGGEKRGKTIFKKGKIRTSPVPMYIVIGSKKKPVSDLEVGLIAMHEQIESFLTIKSTSKIFSSLIKNKKEITEQEKRRIGEKFVQSATLNELLTEAITRKLMFDRYGKEGLNVSKKSENPFNILAVDKLHRYVKNNGVHNTLKKFYKDPVFFQKMIYLDRTPIEFAMKT